MVHTSQRSYAYHRSWPLLVLALLVLPSCGTGQRLVSPYAFRHAQEGSAALRTQTARARADLTELENEEATTRGQQAQLSAASKARIAEIAQEKSRLEQSIASSDAAISSLSQAELNGEIVFPTGLYFSVEPLVALGDGFEATAIPSLGINYRFLGIGHSPLALQLVAGGALNPQGGDSSLGAALGLGLSHPVSDSGALSLGIVAWDNGDETDVGLYISINLGAFGKRTGEQ